MKVRTRLATCKTIIWTDQAIIPSSVGLMQPNGDSVLLGELFYFSIYHPPKLIFNYCFLIFSAVRLRTYLTHLMQLQKKLFYRHDNFLINLLIQEMLNFNIFNLKNEATNNFPQGKHEQIRFYYYFRNYFMKFLPYQNHFFKSHKFFTNLKCQNLISRTQSYDEFLNTDANELNAHIQSPIKLLPTDASFRFLGRYLEVVSLNDSAVGSSQSTEIKKPWEHRA
jgi:hypothetical protein